MKKKTKPDFEALYETKTDENGDPIENKVKTRFVEAVNATLKQMQYDKDKDTATEIYQKMTSAIQAAIATLPISPKGTSIARKVSERTRQLFDQRKNMQGTEAQYRQIQKKIVASSLQDFEDWVGEWAKEIETADGHGDTKRIYQGVKKLSEKPTKPPVNLTTDAQGKLLGQAEDVADVWVDFLTEKFACTKAETERPDMETLPCTQGECGDTLTEEEIMKGLARMRNGKSCGLDEIPAEIYKRCEPCRQLLIDLLQKVWWDEEVPEEFARSTFIMLAVYLKIKDPETTRRLLACLITVIKC